MLLSEICSQNSAIDSVFSKYMESFKLSKGLFEATSLQGHLDPNKLESIALFTIKKNPKNKVKRDELTSKEKNESWLCSNIDCLI